MKLWYISFADEEGFRGGIFTKAVSLEAALHKVGLQGNDPGGEAAGGTVKEEEYPEKYHDKLFSEQEMRTLFDFRRRDEWEKEWKKEENA